MTRFILLLILLFATTGAKSAIFECTTKEGSVSFSDRPCEGMNETQKEMTRISSESAEFYGVSEKSDISITPDMHKLLDLKHRGRSSDDICYRKEVFGDYRVMLAVSAWEKKNKAKLDEITEILNSTDSMAYQLNLVSKYKTYEENLKSSSIEHRLQVCTDLLKELEDGQLPGALKQ